MTILIATGLYPPESGGPATYSKLLKDRLPGLDIEVKVLPFSSVRHLPKALRHAAYFWQCVRQSKGCILIYAQDPVSVGLPAWLASVVTGRTFMVRLGGDYAWEQARQRHGVIDELDDFQRRNYGPATELLRAVQIFVVNRARAVVVPSEYMKGVVGKWTNPQKVHRIYSSINLEPPLQLPKDRPVGFLVLSFGRRVPWKGYEALERTVAREPHWHLKIFSELPYPQAMGWLKSADVYVNNSTYEGLSHQLVESFALGTPVIATNVGGNPELVDNATGLLVPPKDDDALFAAIKEVQNNPQAAHERAARAKERAKGFSMDNAIQQIAALITKVCEF
jgi:glycosyltransferase involved in cell wall biosynthesis